MKKILLLAVMIISIFILSGCSEHPFRAASGTEYIISDTISFDYYNGSNSIQLFEYNFSSEYKFFIEEQGINYHFTSINNYEDISKEFIDLLKNYEDNIQYDRFINNTGNGKIDLSLGATESDFNLTSVSIDDELYDVDAFIVVENGLRIIFSYTEFYHNGELIIVPYHLSILAYEIHEAYLKEFLPENNEYVEEKAVLTKYVTHIIPFPPKVGFWPTVFDNKDELKDLGRFMRIIEDDSIGIEGTQEVCSEDVSDNCFEIEYSTLNGFIYNLSIGEVILFYEENWGGRYDGNNFIFFINGDSYKMSLGETTLNIEYDNRDDINEDVITFEITKYNE